MANSIEELLQDIIERLDRFETRIHKTELLTAKELARELQVSERQVYALSRAQKIPSQLLGKSRRFGLEDVLAHCRIAPKPSVISVEAKAVRDARRIIAGQVVRRVDAQWKRRIAGRTPCK